MKARNLALFAVVSLVVAACGDSSSSDNNDGPEGTFNNIPFNNANNANNGSGTNTLEDFTRDTDLSTFGTSGIRGWKFFIEGDDSTVLPDLQGPTVSAKLDRDVLLVEAETEEARIEFNFVDNRVKGPGNYSADHFRLEFKELNYRCEYRMGVFTFPLDVEPLRGAFEGPLVCFSASGDDSLEIEIKAVFGVTDGDPAIERPPRMDPPTLPEDLPCPEGITPLGAGGFGAVLIGDDQYEIIDFGTGQVVYTTPDTLDATKAMVNSDGSVVAFQHPLSGFSGQAYVSVDAGEATLLPLPDAAGSEPSSSTLVAVSSDGQVLYTCSGNVDGELIDGLCLWRDGDVRLLPEPPTDVFLWDQVDGEFTADGQTLVYEIEGFYMRLDLSTDQHEVIYRGDEPLPYLPRGGGADVQISASDDGNVVAFSGRGLAVFEGLSLSGNRSEGAYAFAVSPGGTKVAINEANALSWIEVGNELVEHFLAKDGPFDPEDLVNLHPFWIDDNTLIHHYRNGGEYRIYRSTLDPEHPQNAEIEVVACGNGPFLSRDSHYFYFSR